MSRREEQIYSDLQNAKHNLQKALEDIKKYDAELGGGYDTYAGEIRPILEEVFGDDVN